MTESEAVDPSARSIVERYFEQVKRHPEIRNQTLASAMARLTWFTAISGFVVLNGRSLWEALAGRSFEGGALLLLTLPWVLTAVLAIATHYLIDQMRMQDDTAHEIRYAVLNLLLDRFEKHERVLDQELQDILHDRGPEELRLAVAAIGPWARWFTRLERWTIYVLIFSFLWAVAGPFVVGVLVGRGLL